MGMQLHWVQVTEKLWSRRNQHAGVLLGPQGGRDGGSGREGGERQGQIQNASRERGRRKNLWRRSTPSPSRRPIPRPTPSPRVRAKSWRRLLANVFAPTPSKEKAAEEFNAACKTTHAPRDERDITVSEAQVVLSSIITEDPTKTLLSTGVYFDRVKFEKDPRVMEAHLGLFAYNAAKYGVKEGTRVRVGNAEGRVKSTFFDTVKIEVQGKVVDEHVFFVLKHAVEGEGVMTVGEDQRQFVLNLGALVAIEYIHVPTHIETDDKRKGVDDVFVYIADEEDEVEKLRCKITGKISGKREAELERVQELKRFIAVNPLIWKFLLKVPAEHTIRVVPKSFTPDLRDFVKKEGSFLEM